MQQPAAAVFGLHAAAVLEFARDRRSPYSISLAIDERNKRMNFLRLLSVAFRPVPIAQTGSYAITSRSGS